MMKAYRVIIGSILLLHGATSIAEIYRCTDENGVALFGDTPCDNPLKTIKPLKSTTGMGDAARNEKRERLLRAYEYERRQQQQRTADVAEKQSQKKKNCAIARNRLQQITRASSIYNLDDDGNRVNLTDSERAQETRQAHEDVAYWCNK